MYKTIRIIKKILISIYVLMFSQIVFSETTLNIEDKRLEPAFMIISYFVNTVDENIEKLPKTGFKVNSPDNGVESKSTSVKLLKEDMKKSKIIKIQFNIVTDKPILRSLRIINYNVDTNTIESIEKYNEEFYLNDNSIIHHFSVFQNQRGWRIISTDYGSTNLVIIPDINGNFVFEQ